MRRSLTMVVAVFATVAYLGLAVWGEGGLSRFVAHPQLVVVAGFTMAMAIAALFTQGNVNSGEREDRGNRWVLAVFGVLGIAAAYMPAWDDSHDFRTFGGDAVRWIGVALFVAGGVLRMAPVFVLGRRFSGLVAIQPGHELVTTGLYGAIRHPSYLGMLVNAVGWALAFRSGLGLALAATTVWPIVARILAEERLLAAQFGGEYEAYRARTARLIPAVW